MKTRKLKRGLSCKASFSEIEEDLKSLEEDTSTSSESSQVPSKRARSKRSRNVREKEAIRALSYLFKSESGESESENNHSFEANQMITNYKKVFFSSLKQKYLVLGSIYCKVLEYL